tara:strand:- start:309 stop:611 length:303 start_codon:yes stop_codon:yes gene_type:complete
MIKELQDIVNGITTRDWVVECNGGKTEVSQSALAEALGLLPESEQQGIVVIAKNLIKNSGKADNFLGRLAQTLVDRESIPSLAAKNPSPEQEESSNENLS